MNYANEHKPEYDFIANDGVGHQFWVIKEKELIDKIQKLFAEMPALYVADGHHRTAAAALVGKEKENSILTIQAKKTLTILWLSFFQIINLQ